MELTGRRVLVSIPALNQRQEGIIIQQGYVSENWINLKIEFKDKMGFFEKKNILDLVVTGSNAKDFVGGLTSTCIGGITHISLLDVLNEEDFFVSVDKNRPVTLSEFRKANTAPDVDPLTKEDFDKIKKLNFGETVILGMNVEVKRVGPAFQKDEDDFITTTYKKVDKDEDFFVSVDDYAPISLVELTSSYELTKEELEGVKKLKLGEHVYLGNSNEVKRVNQLKKGDFVTAGNGLNMVIDSVLVDDDGELISVGGGLRDEYGEERGYRTLEHKEIIIMKQNSSTPEGNNFTPFLQREDIFKKYFDAVNTWVFFTTNYPKNFMEAFDGVDTRNHMQRKFTLAYSDYGASGAMNKFYLELSENNRKLLVEWMMKNYKA
jgi:hypothetical protein